MTNFDKAREEFRTWRAAWGTSICDAVIREHNKKRLENPGREKRKHLSPARKKDLYAKQSGRCGECHEPYPIERLEADHIDPNRQDFNARNNWQLLCKPCHNEKNTMSVFEQSKRTGKTIQEILNP